MITLTPEETRQFGSLFQQYEDSGSGVVNGSVAYPLFIKSGLSTDTLRSIWAVADSDNRGALDLTGFSKALRLIYHVQQGKQFGANLVTIPANLPRFDGGSRQVSAAGGAPAAPVQTNTTGQIQANSTGQVVQPNSTGQTPAAVQPNSTGSPQIPPLGTADKARFAALFDKHARDGLIDGPSARDIFMKAKLSSDTLGKIWNLVSQGQGSLRRNEFILAMHLIQSTMSKQLASIPTQLPESWIPWLQGKQSYIISPHDKLKFDQHFDSLQQGGIVSAEKAADFLKKSNLSEDVLAIIWDLADYREQGSLDRSGFAIAMFLVNKKLGGGELPQRTPPELIESASAVPGGNHARGPSDASFASVPSVASPQVTGRGPIAATGTGPIPVANPAAPPSRTASGSMNDLVNLDDTFFAPTTNVKSPVMSPTNTGKKEAFVPKSSFGQSLVGNSTGTRDLSGSTVSPNIASAAEINRQHSQAQEQHGEAQQKYQQARAQNTQTAADLEATRTAKQQLEQEIGELRSKYDTEAAQVYKAQQEIKQLKEEMASLEKDHNLRKSGFQALSTQHKDLSTQLEDHRSKRDLLASNVADLEQKHNDHQQQLETLTREQQELHEHHTKHTSRLASLEAELANLMNHIESAHSSRAAAETRVAESRQRTELIEAEVAKAREDLASAQARHEQFAKEAAEHEAREKNVKEELSKLQQQKQQVDESIAAAKSRAEKAQKQAQTQADAHAKAQAEAEQQAQAHARAQAEAEAAESALSRDAPATHGLSNHAGIAAGVGAGVAAGVATVGVASHFQESPGTSYKASTLSEQSSPRTSEFQINDDSAVPPSFTLPMARPQSATSSVANNPPQSIRGDVEDVSRPVSPEFNTSTPVNGINPPQNMEIEEPNAPSKLYSHDQSSDSFEFVDANDDQADVSTTAVGPSSTIRSVGGAGDDSSSDEEGPETLPQLHHITPGGTAVYSDHPSHITSAAPTGEVRSPQAKSTPQFSESEPPQVPPKFDSPQAQQFQSPQSPQSQLPHMRAPTLSDPAFATSIPTGGSAGSPSAETRSPITAPTGAPTGNTSSFAAPTGSTSSFAAPTGAAGSFAPPTGGAASSFGAPTGSTSSFAGIAPGAVPAVAPSSANADFGDAFDDLEEAIPDNSDDDSPFNTTQQSHAEPDEWSQLFADSEPPASQAQQTQAQPQAPLQAPVARNSALQGPPVPKKNSPKLPGLSGRESAALAELTSMGFPENAALEALRKCNFNPSEATNLLLDG